MTNGHVFDKIDLMEYVTNSCDDKKRTAIELHCRQCPQCARFCREYARENDGFLNALPFESTIAGLGTIQESTTVLRFRKHGRKPWLFALAASLILTVATFRVLQTSSPVVSNQIKGETGITVYVQNNAGHVEKRDNKVFFTHEKIQFLYTCAGYNNLILLGMDTSGTVTIYYPVMQDSSYTAESGAAIPLPNSILLDDYVGPELFLAVFSKARLKVSDIQNQCISHYKQTHDIASIKISGENTIFCPYLCTVHRKTQ